MISPVWLQILRKGDMDYELTGTHDVDVAWMKNVRSRNEKTKSEYKNKQSMLITTHLICIYTPF